MGSLIVTTAAKYVKIADTQTTTYILLSGLIRLDAVDNDRVVFNGHDATYQQFVRYILKVADIATFNGSNNFTATSIADAILALAIA